MPSKQPTPGEEAGKPSPVATADALYTSKQLGDAGEMLVAAELTLHGVPALTVPANWPGYDIVAQPRRGWPDFNGSAALSPAQRISVKTRTFAQSGHFVGFDNEDDFDWLAIVLLPGADLTSRRIFLVPREVAMLRSYEAKRGDTIGRGFFVHKLVLPPPKQLQGAPPPGGWGLADYEDNFELLLPPRTSTLAR